MRHGERVRDGPSDSPRLSRDEAGYRKTPGKHGPLSFDCALDEDLKRQNSRMAQTQCPLSVLKRTLSARYKSRTKEDQYTHSLAEADMEWVNVPQSISVKFDEDAVGDA